MTEYQDICMMLDANAITNVVDAYVKGRADAYSKIENEINYLLNCGMGKKKGLEHLMKICEAEQIKEQKND